MAGRLQVDLGALADTARALRTLASDFASSSKRLDANRGAVGHEDVVDALEEFTGNWRRHRQALEKSLKAVAKMAEDSHATYVETDNELARQAR